MSSIEQQLKYKFNNYKLLETALTHGSVNSNVSKNYERLEFLGDRVLGMVVASMLYKIFPNEPEGSLSQRFTALVCRETVAEVAKNIGLDKFMFVAENDIRDNENVLCDVCEAVIGAIYIDSGVIDAIKFVEEHWRELIDNKIAPPKDAKTTLQEVAHAKGLSAPMYKILDKSGPEHEPVFLVEVRLSEELFAQGNGHNKKLAEFDAATKMLRQLNK